MTKDLGEDTVTPAQPNPGPEETDPATGTPLTAHGVPITGLSERDDD